MNLRPCLALPCVLVLASALTSCGPDDSSLMPLHEGRSFVYQVSDGLSTSLVDMTFDTRDSFVRLKSERGTSELRWSGGRLVATRLGAVRFWPPVPLIAPPKTTYNGTLYLGNQAIPVTGTLTRENIQITVLQRKRDATLTKLTLDTNAKNALTLNTWFVAGVGIVRQEIVRDGVMLRRLVLVSDQARKN